ncbi:TetR/AcrR family transcriptional regulator [Nonomuraea typhae]|uniref:TetR/AcrR family transcriptional regulator n=1 Tax=Nonomuraea typhae TaxID=2603600 RepID=UPI0012FCF4A2|nr:TetR family transcriptional regulator [Nonomuraea typhae]
MTRQPQARATQRRSALLAAAVEVLTEGGFAALTHRAVAQRARLPLAATTYYFASRDELLAEAFSHLVEREVAHLRAIGLAGLVDDLAADEHSRQQGLWELYVLAARDPALQAIARRWSQACAEIAAEHLALPAGHPRARLLYAAVSYLWLEHTVIGLPLEDMRTLVDLAVKNASRPE